VKFYSWTEDFLFTFSTTQQPLVDQNLFIMDISLSNSDIPHLVETLWPSDQSSAEATQHSYQTDTHWDLNSQSSKQAAADPRLKLRGDWDRVSSGYFGSNIGRINYLRYFMVFLRLCLVVYPKKGFFRTSLGFREKITV
jgi:hypothetical protein